MSTFKILQSMMIDQFELKIEDLVAEAELKTLGVDSLSVFDFLFLIEDKFKIRIPYENLEIKTFGDVVNLVNKIIAEQASECLVEHD